MRSLVRAGIIGLMGLAFLGGSVAVADTHSPGQDAGPEEFLTGLSFPTMDPARGRILFASKGCVACHSINGVGGEDAPPLDASTMSPVMNPFTFAARMWRGAETMVALQRELFGEPIDLTGQELADITSFVHNPQEQKKFSEADIPHNVLELLGHTHSHM